jgi:hypothetical protein
VIHAPRPPQPIIPKRTFEFAWNCREPIAANDRKSHGRRTGTGHEVAPVKGFAAAVGRILCC